MEEEADLIMMAIEMMYQQCILGTMDEIVCSNNDSDDTNDINY